MTTYSEPHPNDKSCGDCVHFSRCVFLMGQEAAETRCDWIPSRFKEEKSDGETNCRRNDGSADR